MNYWVSEVSFSKTEMIIEEYIRTRLDHYLGIRYMFETDIKKFGYIDLELKRQFLG